MTIEKPPAAKATMTRVMPACTISGTDFSGTATPMMNLVTIGVTSPSTATSAAIVRMMAHDRPVPVMATRTRSRHVAARVRLRGVVNSKAMPPTRCTNSGVTRSGRRLVPRNAR
ncbi:unannotated protein [freshwater metagenome]|uniref:Unannotated protein n=1 Tax=freshwater metagenome TaxID=449393 RepID=A0A6J7EK25_9ZZZZ